MKETTICFIRQESGGWEEISYNELLARGASNPVYFRKRFIPLHGYLMEVSEADYAMYYKSRRRERYHNEESARVGEISLESLHAQEGRSKETPVDPQSDVCSIVIRNNQRNRLSDAIALLERDEQILIRQYFYDGMKQKDIARNLGITQQAVSRRIHTICAKLQSFMDS